MTESVDQTVQRVFIERYGEPPAYVIRSPGRVNLIGDHTDYNDGFVLPMAIDRAVWLALSPRESAAVTVHSVELAQTGEFALDGLAHRGGWLEYIQGVAWALQEAGHATVGWRGVVASDIPMGAGLSSSAALELACARGFVAAADAAWEPVAMAKLTQRAEQRWVGMNCGVMDQLICAAGRGGHATLIDCRSLVMDAVPLVGDSTVIVLDTAVRRELVESAYGERRARCEAAARVCGAQALRDVTLAQLDAQREAGALDPVMYRRARHVVTENERTVAAAAALRAGDAVEFGQLMICSHASLRDDFEVSCPELDIMVECATARDECYGARVTGAGFGGCAVALIRSRAADEFIAAVCAAYRARAGRDARAYRCLPADGAELMGGVAE